MSDGPSTVLIVDDEEDICLLLRIRLRLEGFEIAGVAHDGAEAVELYRDHRPDAVIMDLLMPGVSGFEAIGTIRKEFPEARIVAHTGVAGDFVREEMANHGVPVVLKSGDLSVLVDVLRGADDLA